MYYKLALSLALVLINSNAWAEDAELPTSGTCGTDCTWSYDESTKTIKVTGNESGMGMMNEFTTTESAPWTGYGDIAENIVITGVQNVGNRAFIGFKNVKHVKMDDYVTSLGNDSFADMFKLETIKLSNNITSLGWNVFQWDGKDNTNHLIQSIVLPDSLQNTVITTFTRMYVDTLVMPANLDTDKISFYGTTFKINHMYCTGEQMEACSDALKKAGVKIEPTRYEKTADGVVVYDDKGRIVGKYQNTQAIGDGKIDAIYKYSDSGHFIGTFDVNGNRIGKKIYTVEEAMEATKNGDKFHVYVTYK